MIYARGRSDYEFLIRQLGLDSWPTSNLIFERDETRREMDRPCRLYISQVKSRAMDKMLT